jgi:hypothetical protein
MPHVTRNCKLRLVAAGYKGLSVTGRLFLLVAALLMRGA